MKVANFDCFGFLFADFGGFAQQLACKGALGATGCGDSGFSAEAWRQQLGESRR
jgi:hypothetical protein